MYDLRWSSKPGETLYIPWRYPRDILAEIKKYLDLNKEFLCDCELVVVEYRCFVPNSRFGTRDLRVVRFIALNPIGNDNTARLFHVDDLT